MIMIYCSVPWIHYERSVISQIGFENGPFWKHLTIEGTFVNFALSNLSYLPRTFSGGDRQLFWYAQH